MQSNSRRAVIATALAGLAAGCAPIALAATSPDAELLRISARFHQVCAEQNELWERYCAMPDPLTPEASALGERVEGMYHEWASTSDACYAISPSTPIGAAALLGVILVRDAEFIDDAPQRALRVLHDGLVGMTRS